MKYNYYAKNYGKDLILFNRLKLIERLNININSSSKMYAYFQAANLGIILQ